MTIATGLALLALGLAAAPALLFVRNLRAYLPPPFPGPEDPFPGVSVLIPARNEEGAIAGAIASVLASRGVGLELIVYDDSSDDATAAVVASTAARDPRVRLLPGSPLPMGWCGKPHACASLAAAAGSPRLVFMDADVRLEPDGLARMSAFLQASGADLASGIPRQETGTLGERLLIPLIHFILLGFLPIDRMRARREPGYGAGCGQLVIARRQAYEAAGGHGAIRASLHDGLTLPRAFRCRGLRTDLFDATPIASCRMYRGFREVWAGLSKNATEGLACPALIVPTTLLLAGGNLLPWALLLRGADLPRSALALTLLAIPVSYLPRLVAVARFRQSLAGAILHPVGVLALILIQWNAFLRSRTGGASSWKGRTYPIAGTQRPPA